MAKSKGSFNQTTMSSLATITQISTQVGCINRTIGDDGTLAFFAIFIGIVLLCENLLLINLIVRTRSLHTNTNILVASLAITDVLVGALVCLMGLCEQREGLRSWLDLTPEEIRIFDTFLTGLKFSLAIVTICHLSVLALDRYFYVLWPLHYHLRVTRHRVLVTAAILWAIGLIYLSFALIIFKSPEHHTDCIIWNTPAEYGIWPFGFVYLICMCIVFASTIGIAKIAMEHRQRRQRKLPTSNKTLFSPVSKKSPQKCNIFETGFMMVKSPTRTRQFSETSCVIKNISSSINMNYVTNVLSEDATCSGIAISLNVGCPNIVFNKNATSVTFNVNTNFDDYDRTDKKCIGSTLAGSVGHRQAHNASAHFKTRNHYRNFEGLRVAGFTNCKRVQEKKLCRYKKYLGKINYCQQQQLFRQYH